jgi:hypothetical protein
MNKLKIELTRLPGGTIRWAVVTFYNEVVEWGEAHNKRAARAEATATLGRINQEWQDLNREITRRRNLGNHEMKIHEQITAVYDN